MPKRMIVSMPKREMYIRLRHIHKYHSRSGSDISDIKSR